MAGKVSPEPDVHSGVRGSLFLWHTMKPGALFFPVHHQSGTFLEIKCFHDNINGW